MPTPSPAGLSSSRLGLGRPGTLRPLFFQKVEFEFEFALARTPAPLAPPTVPVAAPDPAAAPIFTVAESVLLFTAACSTLLSIIRPLGPIRCQRHYFASPDSVTVLSFVIWALGSSAVM